MRFIYLMTHRLPVLAAALCLSVSGCTATTAGIAAPSAPAPLATEQTLPTLLLAAPDVGAALGEDDVVVSGEVSAPWDDSAHFATGADGSGTDLGCLAIAGAAQRAVYAGTGWTALRGQVLREPPTAPDWSHFATQAVVLFPDAQAAEDFYQHAQDAWAGCTNRELVYAQQLAPDQIWQIGPVSKKSDMLTVTRTQRGPLHWSCQRALSVRGNVAIDVEACDAGQPTDAAAAITTEIGTRMPAT